MSTDQQLVQKVLQGDTSSFKELVHLYERLVFSVVAKLVVHPQEEIEDICQEVFITVFRKLKTFKFESKLSTWIASIAYRQALDHIRKNRPDLTELEERELDTTESTTPETLLTSANEAIFVKQQVALLPAKYKLVITLFHLQEMSIKEIAAIMKSNEGAVKVLLFRARKQLKEQLAHYSLERKQT